MNSGFRDNILYRNPNTRRFASNNAIVVNLKSIFRSHLLPWSRHGLNNVVNLHFLTNVKKDVKLALN